MAVNRRPTALQLRGHCEQLWPVSATLWPRRVRGAFRADALWVGHHLDQLEEHSADVVGPAERLAIVRRTPWWR
ncbi:MAG TPA: hypothetical protein VME44_10165 [Streptosporangiaceae bacterium]|nr:hypothetical protein [Streptosporangiaceae bacterium]